MMGTMARLGALKAAWLVVAVVLVQIHPVLSLGWIVLGFALLIGYSGRILLRLHRLVKEHPNMRWKLP